MNIKPWLPTVRDQKAIRKSLLHGAIGIMAIIGFLAVAIFFTTYPIVLGVIVGLIVAFILLATLWTAFAPTQKDDNNSAQ